MLETCEITPTVPARDLSRARRFYEEQLGLTPVSSDESGITYQCGRSSLYLYETPFAGTAKHTLCSFESEHVDDDIEQLRSRGVRFETYDMPGVTWTDDVAEMHGTHGVWFTDPDGNILALFQRTRVTAGV
jgi:catechol 2,3-dioxygenase-like lactoylglutathione lyase family enzyme